jgi:hypothetical protein
LPGGIHAKPLFSQVAPALLIASCCCPHAFHNRPQPTMVCHQRGVYFQKFILLFCLAAEVLN